MGCRNKSVLEDFKKNLGDGVEHIASCNDEIALSFSMLEHILSSQCEAREYTPTPQTQAGMLTTLTMHREIDLRSCTTLNFPFSHPPPPSPSPPTSLPLPPPSSLPPSSHLFAEIPEELLCTPHQEQEGVRQAACDSWPRHDHDHAGGRGNLLDNTPPAGPTCCAPEQAWQVPPRIVKGGSEESVKRGREEKRRGEERERVGERWEEVCE
eukprot:763930-Hanusia_phi.AAC.10